MDGEAVMERRLIKVAMYWAEIGQIGPATGQRIEAATCRRLARRAAERSNNYNKDGDPDGIRHFQILEVNFDGVQVGRKHIRL